MLEKWDITIPELTGKRQTRKVYIYIPDAAQDDEEARYPVLYMFDGHNVFEDSESSYGVSWDMKNYLDETGTPIIVVGVECNHSPNNGRLSEYTPFSFNDETFGYVYARGKLTMNWMTETLKPMIDERYPTMPEREHTFIGGSSMGGLMTVYAVTQYNNVYSRGAALSPSLWVNPKRVLQMIRSAELSPDTVLYMDYGAREMSNHPGIDRVYMNTMQALMEKQVLLTSRIIPNGDHCEQCWAEEVPMFMQTLLYERE